MADALSFEDAARLLQSVVNRPTAEDGSLTYTLKEVAGKTNLARSAIEADCRNGTLNHVKKGNAIVMTHDQIVAMLAHYSRGGPTGNVEDTELRQARAASQRSGARRGRQAA